MGDKLWKSFERFVGEKIFDGSKRNIGSGKINSCDDGTPRSGDVINDVYEIECKCYKKIAIFRWWDKLKVDAERTHKIPVLVMREVGDIQDTLVTMNYKDFVNMKEKAEMYDGLCK
jgi:hypothetical protein